MRTPAKPFALCTDNKGFAASLIPAKVYRVLPDAMAAKDDLVRIVDESGEDYLYHKDHFVFVDSPRGAQENPGVGKSRLRVNRPTLAIA